MWKEFITVNRLNRQEQAAPVEPDTKCALFCLSTIPIKATRCVYCTSELAAT